MTEHVPNPQKGAGARFIVCSCGGFRTGLGDDERNRQQFADHLRLVKPPTDPYLRSADV